MSHFYSLVELCEDYESKVRTNPLTFVCYFIQWRYSLRGGTDGPARRADTPQALLFEFVRFVDRRRWPSARRSHQDDEDVIAATFARDEEATAAPVATTGAPAGAEGAGAQDRTLLKQRLQRAVQARADEAAEAQKVQVLVPPLGPTPA